MRLIAVFLIANFPFANGCAFLIARSGKDVGCLKTREQVHFEFGEPARTGVTDGIAYDEYHTRRKIAEESRSGQLALAFVMTVGLSEVVTFPQEIFLQAKTFLFGRTIRFSYDDNGCISRVVLEGLEGQLPVAIRP